MNRRVAAAFATIAIVVSTQFVAAQPAPHPPPPVNPHATPEARSLLCFLDSISGQYTMTGQHNFPNSSTRP